LSLGSIWISFWSKSCCNFKQYTNCVALVDWREQAVGRRFSAWLLRW